jgi:hypothetical protein
VVVIGPEVILPDVPWWDEWLESYRVGDEYKDIMVPLARTMLTIPTHKWYSDASYEFGLGGVDPETGLWWQYELSIEQRERLVRDKVQIGDWEGLHINVLELVGMVVNTVVMIEKGRSHPEFGGELVGVEGDNTSAVGWITKAGGAKNPRAGVAIRWLGTIEVHSGWSFESKHVSGEKNPLADCVSRYHALIAQAKLEEMCPGVKWRQVQLGRRLYQTVTDLLSKDCPSRLWERALTLSTRVAIESSRPSEKDGGCRHGLMER